MLAAFRAAARARSLPAVQHAGYAKAAPKAKQKGQSAPEGRDSNMDRILEIFSTGPQKLPPLSAEEHADWNARAKDYSRRKMAQHRAWQKALSTKIKLKEAALAALPKELRAHAETEDLTDPPLSRRMATLTPPISGFQSQQQSAVQTGRRIGTKR